MNEWISQSIKIYIAIPLGVTRGTPPPPQKNKINHPNFLFKTTFTCERFAKNMFGFTIVYHNIFNRGTHSFSSWTLLSVIKWILSWPSMSVVTPFPDIYNYKDSSIVASWDSKVSTGLCIITYYYYSKVHIFMSLVCFKVIHNKSPIKSHQGQRTFVVFPRHRQLASYVPEAHPWVPAGCQTLQHYPSSSNKYFIHVLYENGQR